MTTRKRVGPLPTHRLAMRHSVDHSSSDLFTSGDSSETSLDYSLDDLSDSSSVPSIPHSFATITERPSHPSSASPSRKRSRSSTTYVPISSSIPGALSLARDDLLPPPKRIRSYDFATDLEDCLDESSELSVPRETKIDECIAYVDALKAEGVDVRVVVEAVAREEVEMGAKGPIKVRVKRVMHHSVPDDIPEPAQEEGAIKGAYETLGALRDQGYRIVATGQQSAVLLERISELERDNTRLRGTLDVTNQRVSRLQWRELRVCREMRQI
ncbi:hypothetical protein Tco_0067449 [Tanacetum coccineum]